MSLSIYNKQKQALLNMLSACTTAADPFEDSDDVWKVLVYDKTGRDILAPLLSVAELRSAGVTLHMLLHNARHPIPDVPAVYFVAPTRENVARVAADAVRGTYATLWVNFTSCASREVIEALAEGIAAAARPVAFAGRVSRVFDMYSSFHSLQHNLFSLNMPDAYAQLNATKVTNAEVEALVASIVDRLFCAILTLGVVPFIRSQKGGPAQLVASMLDGRIREHLKANNNAFMNGATFAAAPTERPLLVIVDRALDLPVMLHHTWTYQALAHDVLGMTLNRVTVNMREGTDGADGGGGGGGAGGRRTFDLDQSDAFWTEHAGLPFPMVAEAVEGALQAYQREVADLNRSAGALGDDGLPGVPSAAAVAAAAGGAADGGTADKLAAAVSHIPELAKKKRLIDVHTNIATALLDEIKDRGLDGYFQVEEELLVRPGSFDVERVMALLRDGRGSVDDKLRVVLMYYLCVDSATEGELQRCEAGLREAGCRDLRAYRYVRSIRAFTRSMSTAGATPLANSSSIGGVYAASVLDTLSQVANNVNKLILSVDKALTVAHDVQCLMEGRGEGGVAERYASFDPKKPRGGASGGAATRNAGGAGGAAGMAGDFREAIVFVAGAGNYVEFQNCVDHVCCKVVQDGSRRKMVPNGKTIVYGATELCTGTQFLQQLHANGAADDADGVSTNGPTSS